MTSSVGCDIRDRPPLLGERPALTICSRFQMRLTPAIVVSQFAAVSLGFLACRDAVTVTTMPVAEFPATADIVDATRGGTPHFYNLKAQDSTAATVQPSERSEPSIAWLSIAIFC